MKQAQCYIEKKMAIAGTAIHTQLHTHIKGVQLCVGGCAVIGVPVGTDGFIEGRLVSMLEAHVVELEAVKYFSKQLQWTLMLLCFNWRIPHLPVPVAPSGRSTERFGQGRYGKRSSQSWARQNLCSVLLKVACTGCED